MPSWIQALCDDIGDREGPGIPESGFRAAGGRFQYRESGYNNIEINQSQSFSRHPLA